VVDYCTTLADLACYGNKHPEVYTVVAVAVGPTSYRVIRVDSSEDELFSSHGALGIGNGGHRVARARVLLDFV
jgi:hypothetical protein